MVAPSRLLPVESATATAASSTAKPATRLCRCGKCVHRASKQCDRGLCASHCSLAGGCSIHETVSNDDLAILLKERCSGDLCSTSAEPSVSHAGDHPPMRSPVPGPSRLFSDISNAADPSVAAAAGEEHYRLLTDAIAAAQQRSGDVGSRWTTGDYASTEEEYDEQMAAAISASQDNLKKRARSGSVADRDEQPKKLKFNRRRLGDISPCDSPTHKGCIVCESDEDLDTAEARQWIRDRLSYVDKRTPSSVWPSPPSPVEGSFRIPKDWGSCIKTGAVTHTYTEIPNPGFSSFPVTYPTTTKSSRVSLGFPPTGLGLLSTATSSTSNSAGSSSEHTLIDLSGDSLSQLGMSYKKPRVKISDSDIDIDLTADSDSESEPKPLVCVKKEES